MTSNKSLPRIVELANIISSSVGRLQETLATEGVPSPSFNAESFPVLPEKALADQDAVLDAASELYDLLLDPLSLLFQYGGHNNMVSLQAISRFKIASHVPSQGRVSYEELAKSSGLSKDVLKRLLRHAMTRHIFCEPEPGMVEHTVTSRSLIVPHMQDWMTVGSHEMWPAATKMLDAYQKWPESEEPNETAFSLANDAAESAYQIIGRDPFRAGRFGNAMRAYTSGPGFNVSHVLNNYDWSSLGSTQVVDIGGAQGHVAIALAEQFPNLKILVQDMEMMIAGAENNVPEQVKGRVEFEAHDLFAPQSLRADVFYLRWILHNWSDKYCVLILKSLIPALKPGTRILIQDTLMPEPGDIARWREIDLRSADLNMSAVFNARERTATEWKELVKKADSRFQVEDIVLPRGSALALIDIRWTDGV